jgi:murein DD-endopeptidase MepM/ murein hydrolase activator NlpD
MFRMKNIIIILVLISVTNFLAQEVKFFGEAKPGGVLIGQGEDIVSVQLNKVNIQVDKTGIFILGFDRDAEGAFKLNIKFKNNKVESYDYNLEKREYEEQSLHIAAKYVNPPKKMLSKIMNEQKTMKAARSEVGKLKSALFMSGFVYPMDSLDVRAVFGSQRILNGKKSNIHNGVDFHAVVGDSVHAISDGIVRLAGDNFFYNGNFVLLDHGLGLTSVYLHMSKLLVKNGQRVKKGELIGLAGGTGRATGPHLHLGVQWFNKRIDPMSLFEIKL